LLGFSIPWLLLRVRDVRWFLYNVDCNKIGDVLAKNPIVHKITGLVLTYLLTCLVLEADIPWYTSLDYGPSFNEWTEDDFRSAINSVIQALPNNKFVTIVSDWCVWFFLLGVPFRGSTLVRPEGVACGSQIHHGFFWHKIGELLF